MKTRARIALLLAFAGIVAGCGSSGERSAATPPPTAVDAFTQTVQGVLATTSDTAMPMNIDGIAAVSSDSAPPVGL